MTNDDDAKRLEAAKMLALIDKGDGTGCWLWRGNVNDGYGRFEPRRAGKRVSVRAHRWAYEHFVGPIPAGLHLDHLCRYRLCVNPSHLEPVTNEENNRRSESLSAHNLRKTACERGHAFEALRLSRLRCDDWYVLA